MDFFTASTIRYTQEELLIDISAVCHNISRRLIDKYKDVSHLDIMAMVSYANPGRSIHIMPDLNPQNWELTEEMAEHCARFSIGRASLNVFKHPTKHDVYLSLDYLAEEANPTWLTMQLPRLEWASFPFSLAWFYRKGVFDEAQLRHHFAALSDLTETQLQNLRKFVNCYKPYTAQADDLGIKPSSLKESLYDLRDRIVAERAPDLICGHTKMRFMSDQYAILRMLGDHTAPILR